jgi:hypothetical protein
MQVRYKELDAGMILNRQKHRAGLMPALIDL